MRFELKKNNNLSSPITCKLIGLSKFDLTNIRNNFK